MVSVAKNSFLLRSNVIRTSTKVWFDDEPDKKKRLVYELGRVDLPTLCMAQRNIRTNRFDGLCKQYFQSIKLNAYTLLASEFVSVRDISANLAFMPRPRNDR